MLRKFKLGGVILCALLALVGCQSEKLVDDGSSQSSLVTLTASKGMGNSRTAIVGNQTVWSAGDQIYVSSKDGKVTGVLTLEAEYAGKTEGTFSGFVFGNPKSLEYSVFPAPKNGTVIDLGTIEGAGEVDAPMIGKIDFNAETDVQFANACGVLYVNLIDANKKTQPLIISAVDDNSTGIYIASTIDVSYKNIDLEKLSFKASTNPSTIITIEKPQGGEMYIPYFVTNDNNADLTKVRFKVDGTPLNIDPIDLTQNGGPVGNLVKENIITYTYKGEFVANNSVELAPKDVEIDNGGGKPTAKVNAEIPVDIFSNSGETSDSEGTVLLNVSPSVIIDQTTNQPIEVKEVVVTLPQVDNAEQKAEISISNISKDATVTIKEEETSEGNNTNSIKELTVVLPSGTTEAEAKDKVVVINMPNTTVTVKSADGNVLIIDNMEATTKDETLIVGEDVEISSLTIKKGNVVVYGTIKHLKRDSKNPEKVTEVIIIGNGKVEKYDKIENYNVIYRDNDEKPQETRVSTLGELQDAIDSGVTNIILTKTITLTDDTFINLNGKKLTLSEDFEWQGTAAIVSNGHTLNINGEIRGCKKTVSGKYLLAVQGAGGLGLTDVTLVTEGVANAVYLFDTNLNMDESDISAIDGYAIDVIAQSKFVQVNLGTLKGVGVKGKVCFCNDYASTGNSRLTVSSGSRIDGNLEKKGSNENGLIVVVESGAIIGEGFTGWPTPSTIEGEEVGTLEALQEALLDETVTNIVLTKSIEVSGNLNLGSKTIYLSETFFSDNQDNAAFIITGNDVLIEGDKGSAKIVGSANIKDKYIFKSIGKNLKFNGVVIEAEDALNALYVQDAKLTTSNRTNIKSANGYALDMIAEQSCADAFLRDKTVVSGNVHYLLNSNKNSSFEVDNSSIQGDFTYGGNMGLKMLTITQTNEGTIVGNSWPSSDVVETVEVANVEQLTNALNISTVKNIILIEPLTLDGALDLGGKTLSLSEDFNFGESKAAIMFNGEYGLSNGTFKASSSDDTKYMISSKVGLHLSDNFELVAEDNLNGIYVEDNGCAIYRNTSITVAKGHAFKAVSNNAKVFLQMDANATINGNVFLEANNPSIDNNNIHLMGDDESGYGRINGNVTITSVPNATVVYIDIAKEGLITGKVTGGKVIVENSGQGGGNQGGGNNQGGNTTGNDFWFEEL